MARTPREQIVDRIDQMECDAFSLFKSLERLRLDLQRDWRVIADSSHAKEQAKETKT